MSKRIYICAIEGDYIEYLRRFDDTVTIDATGTRKYVGVLLEVNGHNYYAPLSSPKAKFYRMSDKALDIFKIDGARLGVINLNNMIPVPDLAIIRVNIEDEQDERYKNLLRRQSRVLQSNRVDIKSKATILHSVVNSGTQPRLNQRCSNFSLLEEKCSMYGVVEEITIEQAE